MDHDFWTQLWIDNNIKFHKLETNETLIQFYNQLKLKKGGTVFVPLCGKSLDMLWLAEQGYHVVGVELSEVAVDAFFTENDVPFEVRNTLDFKVYFNDRITIYCGDFFKLNKMQLSQVAGVYDRASLIALPEVLRREYVKQIKSLLPPSSRILLSTLEYDQALAKGPPFSVTKSWIDQHYQPEFIITQLKNEASHLPEALEEQGVSKVSDAVYLLQRT